MSEMGPHTFLFQPGLWEISGAYYDQNNRAYAQKGHLVIAHQPELWTIEGQVTLMINPNQVVDTRYEITPPPPGAAWVEWKSQTSGPEPIYGLFVLVDDVIMMPWQSKSGAYWGQEALWQISATEYRGRGFAFLQNEKVSAWSTQMLLQS